jgi:hypothetical protein
MLIINEASIFLLLWHWNEADTQEDVSQLLQCHQVGCIKINRAIFNLLALHYRRLV